MSQWSPQLFTESQEMTNHIQPAGNVLRGPSQHTLTALGKFHGTLQSANATAIQDIYVAKGLQKALLGRPAIEALGVAVRVDQILDSKAAVTARFPKLFHGLGCMRGAYQRPCCTICFDCSLKSSHCVDVQSSIWAAAYGEKRSHFTSEGTNWLVCRHGCCTQSGRKSEDLCRPDQA